MFKALEKFCKENKPIEKSEGDQSFKLIKEEPKIKFGEHIEFFTGKDNLGYNPHIELINPLQKYDHWNRNLSKLND